MKKQKPEKIDFAKIHKDLYNATSKIKELKADEATFISVEGKGDPGSEAYQKAIQQLYTLAYTTKFMLKNAGKLDFAVSRLECLWPDGDYEHTPRSEWQWRLAIRIPEAVSENDLEQARDEIRQKRQEDTSAARRWTWTEGTAIQVMHVGPYGELGKTYNRLMEFAQANGFVPTAFSHEIYVSDPRRVAPEKLKTIVRLCVLKKR